MIRYTSSDVRWAAVRGRVADADGAFLYGVRTTKIYCRPICKARLARRANVEFFDAAVEAERAGYRACKRCKPDLASKMPEEDAVVKVRAFIANGNIGADCSNLASMAKQTGLSKWHFHRVFTRIAGMTPLEYTNLHRSSTSTTPDLEMPEELERVTCPSEISTPATLDQMHLPPAFDECTWLDFLDVAATNPATFAADPEVLDPAWADGDLEIDKIRYAHRVTALGSVLVAFQRHEVCALIQTESEASSLAALETRYPSILYRHIALQECGSEDQIAMLARTDAILSLLARPLT